MTTFSGGKRGEAGSELCSPYKKGSLLVLVAPGGAALGRGCALWKRMMSHEWSLRISMLADSGVLMPVILCLAGWVAVKNWRLAAEWIGVLFGAAVIVIASKIWWSVFHWTIPIPSFRMISGHMVLAFSVWPVIVMAFFVVIWPERIVVGRVIAFGLCLAIGISRLFGAHTPIEVILGSCIGFLIENRFRKSFQVCIGGMKLPLIMLLCLLGVTVTQYIRITKDPSWLENTIAKFESQMRSSAV